MPNRRVDPRPKSTLQELVEDEVRQGLHDDLAIAIANAYGLNPKAVADIIAEVIAKKATSRR